jgi:hypothetical protein
MYILPYGDFCLFYFPSLKVLYFSYLLQILVTRCHANGNIWHLGSGMSHITSNLGYSCCWLANPDIITLLSLWETLKLRFHFIF